MEITFYKCNGNGNTFIIVVLYNSIFKNKFSKSKIKSICHSIEQEPSDGFILIDIKNIEINMDYFNNDGTWETFCLNGLRCSALILKSLTKDNQFIIRCNNISYKTELLKNDYVQIELDSPKYIQKSIEVNDYIGHYINSGAKHFVIYYKNNWPSKLKLRRDSKKIRYNKILFPDGINVNFYRKINKNTIEVKTYEKGIESMMLSCGSGSYACAFDYSKNNNSNNKIKVLNDGGISQIMFSNKYKKNLFIAHSEIEYKSKLNI